MAAAMNGIALHGGFIPYGGTFLVLRRLCARRHAALGADGPARHLCDDARFDRPRRGRPDAPAGRASGDAARDARTSTSSARPTSIETAEAGSWRCKPNDRPSVLVLSRQNLPMLRRRRRRDKPVGARRLCAARAGGAARRHADRHRLGGRDRRRRAELLAAEQGIDAAVVSMPCWELFEAQDAAYRAAVLGTAPRIAIEAAARLGWDRWIGEDGAFIGMTGFGASAPAPRSLPPLRHHRRSVVADGARRSTHRTEEDI